LSAFGAAEKSHEQVDVAHFGENGNVQRSDRSRSVWICRRCSSSWAFSSTVSTLTICFLGWPWGTLPVIKNQRTPTYRKTVPRCNYI